LFFFKLVGLLSCILAIIFLLTCIYYLICRRRYFNDTSEIPSSVPLLDKNGVSSIPVTTSSQTATTTFINESGKETNSTATGDFVIGMPNMANGHTGSSGTNDLLANGSADPSELRLLQHEHH
jgi:amino acid transporter